MVFQAIILWISLLLDRAVGDPPNAFHPVAYLGRFIGWWGQPARYPPSLQRAAGIAGALITAGVFALPFLLIERLSPAILFLIAGPFLLKSCFAWRCLEEHVNAVVEAADGDLGTARDEVRLLVSRETGSLDREQVLSAAYESMTENLVDSIVSPLFFFTFFGLAGAAFYRAVNTMDAMLGYRDERARLGWCAARLDDIFNYIPARLTGFLLLCYFALKGRAGPAWQVLQRDARNRAGWNGGIPMAVMAGGVGIRFTKAGSYTIGHGPRPLEEAGDEIVAAVRGTTLLAAVVLSFTILFITSLGL